MHAEVRVSLLLIEGVVERVVKLSPSHCPPLLSQAPYSPVHEQAPFSGIVNTGQWLLANVGGSCEALSPAPFPFGRFFLTEPERRLSGNTATEGGALS